MIILQHGLIISTILFFIGLMSLCLRRNLLFILIGLEIMSNAAAMALVFCGSYWHQADGQIMYIIAITITSVEVSIGLALLIQLYRRYHTLNIDIISEMHG